MTYYDKMKELMADKEVQLIIRGGKISVLSSNNKHLFGGHRVDDGETSFEDIVKFLEGYEK